MEQVEQSIYWWRGKREEGRVPAKEGLMKEAQGKMHIYSSDLDMLIQGVPGTRLVESRVVHMVWGIWRIQTALLERISMKTDFRLIHDEQALGSLQNENAVALIGGVFVIVVVRYNGKLYFRKASRSVELERSVQFRGDWSRTLL